MTETVEGSWPNDAFSEGEQREILRTAIKVIREFGDGWEITFNVDRPSFLIVTATLGKLLLELSADSCLHMPLMQAFDQLYNIYASEDDIPGNDGLNDVITDLMLRFGPEFGEEDDDDE